MDTTHYAKKNPPPSWISRLISGANLFKTTFQQHTSPCVAVYGHYWFYLHGCYLLLFLSIPPYLNCYCRRHRILMIWSTYKELDALLLIKFDPKSEEKQRRKLSNWLERLNMEMRRSFLIKLTHLHLTFLCYSRILIGQEKKGLLFNIYLPCNERWF